MAGNAQARHGPAVSPTTPTQGTPHYGTATLVQTKLVQTKLVPPLISDAALRPDLLASVGRGAKGKLLLVCAPAGYGKSTLLAEAARQLGWRAAWYTLDALDHDPTVFIAALVQAIRRHVPQFGEIVSERLACLRDAPITAHELVALFVTELHDEVTDELYIVLDDYHEAADSAELNRGLDYLLANMPTLVHLVLLTRYEPSFSTAKLRLEDQVAELRYEDLRFDMDQLARVVASRSAQHLSPSQTRRLLELTEGWPASVILACKALEWTTPATMEANLADPRLKYDVFSYLAEQVYQREDEETRAFLRHTCCLEYMTVELANRVARIDDAQRYLDYLSRNQVFTFADAGRTSFRYHNFFREYLRHRVAQEEGARQFRELQLRAAAAVEDAGDFGVAVEIYLSANEPNLALRALLHAGESFIDNCTSDTLRTWLDRLSAELIAEQPAASLLAGHLRMREGRFGEAITALQRAGRLWTKAKNRQGMYQAASALECTYFWKDDMAAAADHARRAIRLASDDTQRAHSLASLGLAMMFLFRWDECEAAWAEAQRICPPQAQGELVRIAALRMQQCYLRGDYASAVALGAANLPNVRRQGSKSLKIGLLNCLATAELLCSWRETAQAHAEECLSLVAHYGLEYLRHLVEDTLGQIKVAVGEHGRGVELLYTASMSPIAAEDESILAISHSHLGTAARRNGDLQQARMFYEKACTISEENSYARLNAEANLAYVEGLLASTANITDDHRNKLRLIEQAAARQQFAFVRLKAKFFGNLLGYLTHHDDGDLDGLVAILPEQLHLGHRHFLREELRLQPFAGAAILSQAPPDAARDLLTLMCQTPSVTPLLEASLSRNEPTALLVLETSAGMLDTAQVAHLASLAKKSASPVIRQAARRLHTVRGAHGETDIAQLTRREAEILELVAQGLRNREIAEHLYLAPATVKTHINRIFAKLGVTDRVQAVLCYQHQKQVAHRKQ